jgi:hypothetical protein
MRASQHDALRLLAMQQVEFRMTKRALEICRRIKDLAALQAGMRWTVRWRGACERRGVTHQTQLPLNNKLIVTGVRP